MKSRREVNRQEHRVHGVESKLNRYSVSLFSVVNTPPDLLHSVNLHGNERLISPDRDITSVPLDHNGLWLSLARAPRSGRGGRGFESHQPDQDRIRSLSK